MEPATLDRIIRHESWGSELAILCYVTYLFTLRLPSEALTLTRASPNDRLLSMDEPANKGLIGLREFHGEQRLVLKLAKRENTKNAFIATRPCFCTPNALIPRHNCPIHRFWAAVIKNTEAGKPLPPHSRERTFPAF